MTTNARSYHPAAWLVWILSTAILTMVIRNPLYTLIILVASQIMLAAFGQRPAATGLSLWRFGMIVLLVSAAYNAFFIHVGDTVLLRLPNWPLIGGAVTLESLVFGAANGLILVTLLSIFITLQAAVPASELIRLLPAGLYDLGVVVVIGLTYVPETVSHYRRIKEAQAIRGHRMRGIRDWRPLIMPLLIGGLERAVRLAETMVARGYGAGNVPNSELTDRLGMVVGLCLSLSGWLLALWIGWPGWLLLSGGCAVLGVLIWRSGKRSRRTRYRPGRWRRGDTLLVLLTLWPLAASLFPWGFVQDAALSYSPYPRLEMPLFDPLVGVSLALLAMPALLRTERTEEVLR